MHYMNRIMGVVGHTVNHSIRNKTLHYWVPKNNNFTIFQQPSKNSFGPATDFQMKY
jgi:hypothetical protein